MSRVVYLLCSFLIATIIFPTFGQTFGSGNGRRSSGRSDNLLRVSGNLRSAVSDLNSDISTPKSAGLCRDGWVSGSMKDFSGKEIPICFKVNPQPQTWQEAQTSCRKDYGFLLKLDSKATVNNGDLLSTVIANGITKFWSGMHTENNHLTWDDLIPNQVRPHNTANDSSVPIRPWRWESDLADDRDEYCGQVSLITDEDSDRRRKRSPDDDNTDFGTFDIPSLSNQFLRNAFSRGRDRNGFRRTSPFQTMPTRTQIDQFAELPSTSMGIQAEPQIPGTGLSEPNIQNGGLSPDTGEFGGMLSNLENEGESSSSTFFGNGESNAGEQISNTNIPSDNLIPTTAPGLLSSIRDVASTLNGNNQEMPDPGPTESVAEVLRKLIEVNTNNVQTESENSENSNTGAVNLMGAINSESGNNAVTMSTADVKFENKDTLLHQPTNPSDGSSNDKVDNPDTSKSSIGSLDVAKIASLLMNSKNNIAAGDGLNPNPDAGDGESTNPTDHIIMPTNAPSLLVPPVDEVGILSENVESDNIKENVGDSVGSVIENVKENIGGDIVGNIGSAVSNAGEKIGETLSDGIGSMSDNPPATVVDNLAENVQSVLDDAPVNLGEHITETIGSTFSNTNEHIGNVNENVAEAVGNTNEKIGEDIGNVNENIAEVIGNTNEKIGEAIENVNENAAGAVDNANVNIGETTGNLKENVPETITNIHENIAEVIGNINENVAETIGNLNENVDKVNENNADTIGNIDTKVGDNNNIVEHLNTLFSNMNENVGETGEQLTNNIDSLVGNINENIGDNLSGSSESVGGNLQESIELPNIVIPTPTTVDDMDSNLNPNKLLTDDIGDSMSNSMPTTDEPFNTLESGLESIKDAMDNIEPEMPTVPSLEDIVPEIPETIQLPDAIETIQDRIDDIPETIKDMETPSLPDIFPEQISEHADKQEDTISEVVENINDRNTELKLNSDGIANTGSLLPTSGLSDIVEDSIESIKEHTENIMQPIDIELDDSDTLPTGLPETVPTGLPDTLPTGLPDIFENTEDNIPDVMGDDEGQETIFTNTEDVSSPSDLIENIQDKYESVFESRNDGVDVERPDMSEVQTQDTVDAFDDLLPSHTVTDNDRDRQSVIDLVEEHLGDVLDRSEEKTAIFNDDNVFDSGDIERHDTGLSELTSDNSNIERNNMEFDDLNIVGENDGFDDNDRLEEPGGFNLNGSQILVGETNNDDEFLDDTKGKNTIEDIFDETLNDHDVDSVDVTVTPANVRNNHNILDYTDEDFDDMPSLAEDVIETARKAALMPFIREKLMQLATCEAKLPSVCFSYEVEIMDKASTCDDGWYGHVLLDTCYKVLDKKVSYNRAYSECSSLGARLVMSAGDFERKFVLLAVQKENGNFNGAKFWMESLDDKKVCQFFSERGVHSMPSCNAALRVVCVKDAKSLSVLTVDNVPFIGGAIAEEDDSEQDRVFPSQLESNKLPCSLTSAASEFPVLWFKDGVLVETKDKYVSSDLSLYLNGDLVTATSTVINRELATPALQGRFWCEVWDRQTLTRIRSNVYNVRFSDVMTFHGSMELPRFSQKEELLFNMMNEKFPALSDIEMDLKHVFHDVVPPLKPHVPGVIDSFTFIDNVRSNPNVVNYHTYFTLNRDYTTQDETTVYNRLKSILRSKLGNRNYMANLPGHTPLRTFRTLSLQSTVSCPASTLQTNKDLYGHVIPLKVFSFPKALLGQFANSVDRCSPTNPLPSGTARCMGDFYTGAYWGEVTANECIEETPIDGFNNITWGVSPFTEKLTEMAQSQIDTRNVEKMVAEVAQITEVAAKFTPTDINKIADVLDHSTQVGQLNVNVGKDMLRTVDKLMTASNREVHVANVETKAANRIIKCIERFAEKADLGKEEKVRFVSDNVVVEIWDLKPSAQPVIGLAAESKQVRTDAPFKTEDIATVYNRSHLYDAMVDAAIELPAEVFNRQEKGRSVSDRLTMMVFRKSKLFEAAISDGDRKMAPSEQQLMNLNSYIISASIAGKKLEDLTEKVKTIFKPLKDNGIGTKCVWWDFDMNNFKGGWSNKGCVYDGKVNGRDVCLCDHLTNFAVLIDIYGQSERLPEQHELSLSIITVVGLSLSILGLALTIISYVFFRKLRQGRAQQTLFNLSLALLLSMLVFLVGIRQTHNDTVCKVVAILLHYLILVSFMWMLMEAILQYLTFVKILGTYITRFTMKTVVPAWGLPLIPIISVLSIDHNLYKGGPHYCWMALPAFYYAFAIPVTCIILINVVIFFITVVSIFRRGKGLRSNQKKQKMAMTNLQAAITSFILLGLTWVFGYLAIADARLMFQYVFTILNSLQGFFIFILFVVRKKKVREQWYFICCKGMEKDRVSRSLSASNSIPSTYSNGSNRNSRKTGHDRDRSDSTKTVQSTYSNSSNGFTNYGYDHGYDLPFNRYDRRQFRKF